MRGLLLTLLLVFAATGMAGAMTGPTIHSSAVSDEYRVQGASLRPTGDCVATSNDGGAYVSATCSGSSAAPR